MIKVMKKTKSKSESKQKKRRRLWSKMKSSLTDMEQPQWETWEIQPGNKWWENGRKMGSLVAGNGFINDGLIVL
jgi:hypothetical protein